MPYIVSLARDANRVLVADNTNQILAWSEIMAKTLSGRVNTSLLESGENVVVGTADGFANWLSVKPAK